MLTGVEDWACTAVAGMEGRRERGRGEGGEERERVII